jgi:hypothetical protein
MLTMTDWWPVRAPWLGALVWTAAPFTFFAIRRIRQGDSGCGDLLRFRRLRLRTVHFPATARSRKRRKESPHAQHELNRDRKSPYPSNPLSRR